MAATANKFARAFESLLNHNDRACRTPQFVLISGKKHRAIIQELRSEEVQVFGGRADAGGFTCQVAASGFSEAPEKGDTIQSMGTGPEFEILGDVIKRNDATYEIVAGDPANER